MELLIQNTYQVVSLMQAGRFTETLKQIDASKHQLDLDFEVAYCHYRLNDPRKALSVLEGVANPQVRFMILSICYFVFLFQNSLPGQAQRPEGPGVVSVGRVRAMLWSIQGPHKVD